MEWLTEINAYHWLALGLILFAAEALGAAGFLLGTAAAALVVGLLSLVMPGLGVATEFALFAIIAMVASLLYIKVFRDEQEAKPDQLNHRAESLIGTEFELTEDLPGGDGRVQIGDTFWHVRADAYLERGERVRVVSADTMQLKVAEV
ncbi:MAG: NfeD family protein [Gammaproteobacteria bacterium]|nr:MAG: NfeD family protein [Gammaproteobacteria bacterium]